MPLTAHRHDPEARPSWFRTLTGLPLLAYRLVRWRALRGGWLLDFLRTARRFDRRALPAGRPVDVIVLVSDHYEPARRFGDAAAVESVRSWCAAYEEVGRPPSGDLMIFEGPMAIDWADGCVDDVREVEARLEGGRLKALRVEGEGETLVGRRDGPPARLPGGECWRPAPPPTRHGCGAAA